MESGNAKLFLGGVSWGTTEECLKEYFSSFGEVVESVIMKDRNTGRARGFGFVVFADPAVAESVVKEKHNIDGWMVEAKWAVPRDDPSILSKSSSSARSSPGLGRTKKIFVGGLASSVTESDFKIYFEQFGSIIDAIVMYDPSTKRPRGFGFITFDKEDSVDRVLQRTFHELNGKMVEVKRAVPKELSPSPSHSPLGGYGLSRVSNILSGFNQGYLPGLVGQYGLRMGNRFGPFTYGQSDFSMYGPSYGGMSMNLNPSLMGSSFPNNGTGLGRATNSYAIFSSNRLGSNVNFANHGGNSSLFSPITGNFSGNAGLDYVPNAGVSGAFGGSSTGSIVGDTRGTNGLNLGSIPYSAQGIGNIISPNRPNSSYISGDHNLGLGVVDHGHISGVNAVGSSAYTSSSGVRSGAFQDSYGTGASSEQEGLESYTYGFAAPYDAFDKSSNGYIGYGKRQTDIGIAT